MKTLQQDMTTGNPAKTILNFTFPIFIGNVFQQFYNMADTIIVGKFVGTKALAAVGSTGTIMFLIIGFVLGMTAGFTVLTAQKFGAGDMKAMRQTVGGAAILSGLVSVVLTILSMAFMKPLLRFMQTPSDIFADAYAYIMIICAGIFAQMLYNLLACVLRALGNSKIPLYFLILSAILNIGLDLLLIVGFNLGAAGAAYATVAAQGVSGVLCLLYIVKKVPLLRMEKEDFRPRASLLKMQLGVGFPMALQYSITAVGTMMVQTQPFQTFTETGFPPELIAELERRTGRKVIGNKSASGTEILDELGEEEIASGHMIVYTSADSVLQICGNEETFGLDELYRCCEIARELTMKEEWRVGRVIARPYLGRQRGAFKRTSNRHDYALKPYGKTALDALKQAGLDVISVGKIFDIFDGEGLTESNKSKSSVHGMEQTLEIMGRDFRGLCFVNLVDFDALWGHRRNPQGYAEELERFDEKLGVLLSRMTGDDLLLITADHGNDPTYKGTDHTRERVPLLLYSPAMEGGGDLGASDTFAVVGATVAENFGVPMPDGTIGHSLLGQLT